MARSVKEFWRRWHISLSRWFSDYVYIPLGGSRCRRGRHLCNLLVTFLCSGAVARGQLDVCFVGGCTTGCGCAPKRSTCRGWTPGRRACARPARAGR